MINKSISLYWVLSILTVFSIFSCQQPGKNVTGSEYMPDMAHSIAYEANTYGYYYNNRWGSEGDLHKMVQPRIPTKGTIAVGSVGGIYGFGSSGSHQGIALQANGAMPYYYSDTEDERIRAINDIVKNPFPITDAGLKKQKDYIISIVEFVTVTKAMVVVISYGIMEVNIRFNPPIF